jgi:molybdate/tungstate transport system substrate-binding protein
MHDVEPGRTLAGSIGGESSRSMKRVYLVLAIGLLVGAGLGFGVGQTLSSSGNKSSAPTGTGTKPFALGAAGTLQFAFGQLLNDSFKGLYPGIQVAPPLFEGSGAVAQEENLTKQFSAEAAADTTTIPSVLFPTLANYEIAFGITSMVIIINLNTPQGKDVYSLWQQGQNYAPMSMQSNQTWKQIFSIIAFNSTAVIGAANPFTDSSGFQAICMTKLAGQVLFGNSSILYDSIYNNPSKLVTRNTETDLLPIVSSADLSFIISAYQSNAIPQVRQYSNTAYITLPPDISLGNMSYLNLYHSINFTLTQQGTTRNFTCNPVVYSITIPKTSPNPVAATLFIEDIYGQTGQQILSSYGIRALTPGVVYGNYSAVPDAIKPFVTPATGEYSLIFPK